MRTVAIYGFAPNTRHYIHESEAFEVWTLNNAYKHDVPMERVTRWYELHSINLFGEITKERRNWLRRKHSFPIYMHKHYKSFPASVEFPIDDIVAFIGRRYFSNTIAYMIAHAALEGVDRLELYGVEMDFGTEYYYQKSGTEYIIRAAESAGVEIYTPPGCSLMREQLYGYDGYTQLLPADFIKEHIKIYENYLGKLVDIYRPMIERYENGEKEIINDIIEMNKRIWMYEGASSYLRRIVDAIKGRVVVKRQDLERERVKLIQEVTDANSYINRLNGIYSVNQDKETSAQIEEYTILIHNHYGVIQAVNKLIREIDKISYDMDLKDNTIEVSA